MEASDTHHVVYVEANTVPIVQKYIHRCIRQLPEYCLALERQNFSFLIQEAHKIKGTGALMGVLELHVLGQQLEMAARANDAAELQIKLSALEHFLKTVAIAAQV